MSTLTDLDDTLDEDMDDYFADVLKKMSEYADEEFKKMSENSSVNNNRICNLCKHFSLLSEKCDRTNEFKNKKDTCFKWEA